MIKHTRGFCPPQLSELLCAMLSEDECFRWNVVFIMNDPHISELRQIINDELVNTSPMRTGLHDDNAYELVCFLVHNDLPAQLVLW